MTLLLLTLNAVAGHDITLSSDGKGLGECVLVY